MTAPWGRHLCEQFCESLVRLWRSSLVLSGRIGIGYLDVILYFQIAGLILGDLLGFFLRVAIGNGAVQFKLVAFYGNSDVGVSQFGVLLQGSLHLALNIACAGCGVALRHLALVFVLISALVGF